MNYCCIFLFIYIQDKTKYHYANAIQFPHSQLCLHYFEKYNLRLNFRYLLYVRSLMKPSASPIINIASQRGDISFEITASCDDGLHLSSMQKAHMNRLKPEIFPMLNVLT